MSIKGPGALSAQPTRDASFDREDEVPVATEAGARKPLGPLEKRVLARVNGRRTIGEIARQVGLMTAETAAVVARLREVGAVETATNVVDVALDEDWDAPKED